MSELALPLLGTLVVVLGAFDLLAWYWSLALQHRIDALSAWIEAFDRCIAARTA